VPCLVLRFTGRPVRRLLSQPSPANALRPGRRRAGAALWRAAQAEVPRSTGIPFRLRERGRGWGRFSEDKKPWTIHRL